MSFFRRLVGTAAPIVGGVFGGPAGAALGTAVGSAIQRQPRQSLVAGGPQFMPTLTTAALPALPGVIASGAGVVMRGGAAIARGAVAWCRRNPAWCASVGGTAAVAGMIEQGTLPMPRRRRGRGLSARDIRGFRKTHRLVRQVIATTPGVGRRGRGRSSGPAATLIAQN